jgi:hypothetical protein
VTIKKKEQAVCVKRKVKKYTLTVDYEVEIFDGKNTLAGERAEMAKEALQATEPFDGTEITRVHVAPRKGVSA